MSSLLRQIAAANALHSSLDYCLLTVALATQHRFTTDHMDVKTAFLYGVLEEVVYARLPPGVKSVRRQ